MGFAAKFLYLYTCPFTNKPPEASFFTMKHTNRLTPALYTALQRGEVLIYPTETVYGIGGDARSTTLIQRVQQIKGRDAQKPMLVLTDTWERAADWIATTTPIHARMMAAQLPITLLFAPSKAVPTQLRGLSPQIGIRQTTDLNCLALIKEAGCLLLSTSANPAGSPPVSDLQHLSPHFLAQADWVLDIGALPPSRPSTVVGCIQGTWQVLREGNIPESVLRPFWD